MAKGKSGAEAWIAAGYETNAKAAAVSANRMLKRADIVGRYNELLDRRDQIEVKATERAIEKLAITKEAVLSELAKIGFANMLDYVKVQTDGSAFVDLSALTRDQAAAIQEVVVDEYKEGAGEDARDVKRIRFKLADKKGALVDIGKHFGMFIDRKEVGGPGAFSQMTDEELMEERKRVKEQLQASGLINGSDAIN